MRDLQFWIYVIVGVIYLISRARKKRQAAEPPVNTPEAKLERRFQPQEQATPAPQRGLTFEELLREISEAKASVEPVPQPKSEYVDYDEDLAEEEQDLEDVSGDYRKKDEAFYDTYEEAKRQAFNRPSLEETVKLKDTDMKFGKFKEFEEDTQSNVLNDYLKELKDPDGFKKAFVLSEVLQRRY